MLLLWIIAVGTDFMLCMAYFRYPWRKDFWSSTQIFWNFAHLAQISLLVEMIPPSFGLFPEDRVLGTPQQRAFVAFIGAANWFRMLDLLSSLEILDLGRRILPIWKTLTEIT